MKLSKIGWTDFSGGPLNFVGGCTPVSEGCKNCYARAIYERFGRDFSEVKVYPDKLAKLSRMEFPLHSPRRGVAHRPMVFPVDMGDLFHENVSGAFIGCALAIMAERKDMVWQILTKRAARMNSILSAIFKDSPPPDNLWFGVSVENQRWADERIPLLLQTPAAMRWVSYEPALGPVDFEPFLPCEWYGSTMSTPDGSGVHDEEGIGWLVCGAESGPNRRPFDMTWAHNVLGQCQDADIPYFFKQGSYLYPGRNDLLDGRRHKKWPR